MYAPAATLLAPAADTLEPPLRRSVSDSARAVVRVQSASGAPMPWSDRLTPYMRQPMDALESRRYKAVIFIGPAQSGKALALDTPIPTPAGWTTMADVRVGDRLFSETGAPCHVVFTTDVQWGRECYRVEFSDGSVITADAEHRWTVERFYWRAPQWRSETRTTAEMLHDGIIYSDSGERRKRYRYRIRNAAPLQCADAALPVDPYLLGVWLGDGDTGHASISAHNDDAQHYVDRLVSAGHTVKVSTDHQTTKRLSVDLRARLSETCQRGHDLADVGRTASGYCKECQRLTYWRKRYGHGRDRQPIPEPSLFADTFQSRLRAIGVLNNKHIPVVYLRAGVEQRWELLRGLLDTDGTPCKKAVAEYSTVIDRLKDDVMELARSLGLKPKAAKKRSTWTHNGVKKTGSAWRVTFPIPSGSRLFALERKAAKVKAATVEVGCRAIVAITPIQSVPVRCIQVDAPSHLYLAGKGMIPTHNTQALIDCWIGHIITASPSDMMLILPTQSVARDFEKDRWRKLRRMSPEIAARISKRGHDDNTYDKVLATGDNLYLKWPSENELQGKSIRRMALTDYDRMPLNIGNQGSAFELAKKRTRKFRSLAMTLCESSPGQELLDPNWRPATPHQAPPCKGIMSLYNLGDRHRYYWPCPHCGEFFMSPPSADYFVYECQTDLLGTVVPETLGEVRIPCTNCGELIEESQRPAMLSRSVWVPDGAAVAKDGTVHGHGPQTDTASFWLHGVHAAFASWRDIVLSYLQAKRIYATTGDEEPLRAVVLQDFAAPFVSETRKATRDVGTLESRKEPLTRGTVPLGVRFLLASVDVQGGQNRRFVVQVTGWGPHLESWIIDRFSLRYLDEERQVRLDMSANVEHWDVLKQHVIHRTYPLADGSGRHLPVHLTLCDSGGEDGVTDRAYAFARRIKREGLARRFLLVKGATTRGSPKTELRFPDTAKRQDRKADSRGDIPVLFLNGNQIKDQLYNNLNRAEPGPGYMHFGDWLGAWFFDELNSERRQSDGSWLKVSANEAPDLYAYQLAAIHHLGIDKCNWTAPPPWAMPWDDNPEVLPGDGVHETTDLEPLPAGRQVRFRQRL